MNQTYQSTTATYTTNLRDQIELYYQNPFPEEFDFYTENEDIKEKFISKFVDYYYFRDLEWEQFAVFKHHLKALLNLNMPHYKVMYDHTISVLDLNNVDITEIINREVVGSGTSKSKSKSDSESDSTATSSTSDKNKVVDHDTPMGKIDLNNLNTHASGVTATDGTGTGSNTSKGKGSSESIGDTENTAMSDEDSVRTLKGYQGSMTYAELKNSLISMFNNIDKIIIEDCEELFLKIY